MFSFWEKKRKEKKRKGWESVFVWERIEENGIG